MLSWQILRLSCFIPSVVMTSVVWWMSLAKRCPPYPVEKWLTIWKLQWLPRCETLCITSQNWGFVMLLIPCCCFTFQIPPELYSAFISAINKGNIKTMPNRSMPASPLPTPGALLLGDAFNMRHPLTGGGMTVALSDVVVLMDLFRPLQELNDAAAVCKYLEAFYTLRKVIKIHICIHIMTWFLNWYYWVGVR